MLLLNVQEYTASLLLSVLKTKQSKTKKQAVRKRKKRQQKSYIQNKCLIWKSFQAFGYPLTLFPQLLIFSCGAEFSGQ